MKKGTRTWVCLLVLLSPCHLVTWSPGHLVAAATTEPRRLTHDGGFKQHLCWSADGSKFLFTRIHQGQMGLWTMNADGSDLKPLRAQNTPHFDGHWSPDGKR